MRLLDYGFATYDSVKVADRGEVLGTVIVEKGSPSLVNAIAEEKISLLVKKGEAGQVVKSSVLFKEISAPLTSGEPIGELLVYKNDQEIGRYPLVAETDIERAGLFEIYKRMLNTLM